MKTIKGIIFDCEGVVIDTQSIWDKTQNRLIEARGHIYDPREIREKLIGVPAEHAIKMLKKHYLIYESKEELEREQEEHLLEFLESELRFIEGFQEFHKQHKNDFRTCMIASLKGKALEKVIQKMSLLDFFDDNIFSYSQVRNHKPHPDIFLLACEKLGLHPQECLIIEDSPKGIQAAKKAGIKCAILTTTFPKLHLEKEEPDWIVDKFKEITPHNY